MNTTLTLLFVAAVTCATLLVNSGKITVASFKPVAPVIQVAAVK